MTRKRARLTFKYVSENLYEIHDYGAVCLCVRAFGASALVVDKGRTAAVAKFTTNIDRFDLVDDALISGDEEIPWWMQKVGPHDSRVDVELVRVLDDIVEHHKSYLAKIIVE